MRNYLPILKGHDGRPKWKPRNKLKQTLSARPACVFSFVQGLMAAWVSSPCSFRSLSLRSPPKLCRISLLIWNSQCALTVSRCSFQFSVSNRIVFGSLCRFEGYRGFYKGLKASLTRVVPACMVTFLVYENVSHFLLARRKRIETKEDASDVWFSFGWIPFRLLRYIYHLTTFPYVSIVSGQLQSCWACAAAF